MLPYQPTFSPVNDIQTPDNHACPVALTATNHRQPESQSALVRLGDSIHGQTRRRLTDSLDGRDILGKMDVSFEVHIHVGKIGRPEGSVGVAVDRWEDPTDLARDLDAD